MMLAKLHRWRGEHDDAERLLAAMEPGVLADDPARARYAITRGENLFRGAGRVDEALAVLWIAVSVSRLRLVTGDLVAAMDSAREAAIIFGDAGDPVPARVAWAGLARVAAHHGDLGLAREAAVRADSIDPGGVRFLDAELGWARAWVLAAQGELPVQLSSTRQTRYVRRDKPGSNWRRFEP